MPSKTGPQDNLPAPFHNFPEQRHCHQIELHDHHEPSPHYQHRRRPDPHCLLDHAICPPCHHLQVPHLHHLRGDLPRRRNRCPASHSLRPLSRLQFRCKDMISDATTSKTN